MQSNSFKKFRRENYNSIFAQKWKKAEEAVGDSKFSATGLCDVSDLSLSTLHQKIRESLPLAACDLLRLLILANTRLAGLKSGIRYSGQLVVASHMPGAFYDAIAETVYARMDE